MINWKIFLTKNKYLLILIIAVVVLSLLPVFDIALMVQGAWQGVISTEIYADSQYYHARFREIKDGYPFIGNPFYIEHRADMPPTFFVADWLMSLPFLLGLSLPATLIIDFIFWSLVFAILGYKIFEALGLSKKTSALGALFIYLLCYNIILRPTSYQVVYPVFLLFIWLLVRWLKHPAARWNYFFLAAAAALCFYTYPFLEQVVLVTLLFYLAVFLFLKNWTNLKRLLAIGFWALVFSLPLIIFTIKQVSQTYYWETMFRHGLVQSHWPTAVVFYADFWVVAGCFLLGAFRVVIDKKQEKFILADWSPRFFLLTLGAALVATSLSNVISGKEMEIGMHVELFILLWLGMVFVWALAKLLENRNKFSVLRPGQKTAIVFLLLVCGAGAFWYLWRYSPLIFLKGDRAVKQNYEREIQTFAAPLRWLDQQADQPQVIWASYDSPINVFIPILTKHYVLFADGGKLQLISSEEQKERYLVSGFARNLSQADITDEFVVYAGRRLAIYEPNTHNRQVRVCQLLSLNLLGYDCGKITDVNSLAGENFFQDLYKRYLSEIKPNINQELKKFQVAYIIKDKQINKNFEPEKLNGAKKVYSDERFEVYKLN